MIDACRTVSRSQQPDKQHTKHKIRQKALKIFCCLLKTTSAAASKLCVQCRENLDITVQCRIMCLKEPINFNEMENTKDVILWILISKETSSFNKVVHIWSYLLRSRFRWVWKGLFPDKLTQVKELNISRLRAYNFSWLQYTSFHLASTSVFIWLVCQFLSPPHLILSCTINSLPSWFFSLFWDTIG